MIWRLFDEANDARLVAFGDAGRRSVADLRADTARVSAALPEPSAGSHVLLVFGDDRYAFAVAMLGAWLRGHAVALPPNTRRESVWAIREREECVAIVHDTGSGAPLRIDRVLDTPLEGAPPAHLDIAPQRVLATVFTSGSSGATRGWPKRARQLLGEAAAHAETFGFGEADRFAATVAPGHIYGLLWSVLVPLLGGASFMREAPLHVETVAEKVAAAGANVLVTVPAHLRGLAHVDGGRLSGLSHVFSSTAPLREETAVAFRERHDRPITEVLGSSETGGIATRVRGEQAAWQPLAAVDIAVDDEQHLLVTSPFVDAGVPQPYRTSDLAELHEDGTFVHRGRADGVVKVGGRRVSLPAMEAWLQRQDGIVDATVVAVDAPGGRGVQLLAAVVGTGWDAERVREALAERFERSCVPRRVLSVDALPRENNGKLQRSRVLRLFGLDAEGRPLRWDLEWSAPRTEEDGDHTVRVVPVHVPPTYGWYEGHFPGYPILAGAVQLHEMVVPAIRDALPELGQVRKLTRLKFLDRILPDDRIDVELRWRNEEPAVEFRLKRGETTCSAGRIAFDA